MQGLLELGRLKQLVEAGEIDTVVVAFPDMQGRLMGKRVAAHFFLDSVVEETHGCDYLLTVDMEMEPVPGYEAASWATRWSSTTCTPAIGSTPNTTAGSPTGRSSETSSGCEAGRSSRRFKS